ncbi:Acylphosphatase [Psidium guajava]|nr:Acylphosphatase [Psidium guajava]
MTSVSPEGKSKGPEFSWFRLPLSAVIDKKIGNNVDEVRTQGEKEDEEEEDGRDPEEDGEQDERDERLEEADVRRSGEQHRVSGPVWQASVVTAINRQAT